jgi:aspartate ammonia-lyase
MNTGEHRLETDSLGSEYVPAESYWGIHTLRALQNFPISGIPISRYPQLIRSLAAVKQAAAAANHELGLLTKAKAEAIAVACERVRSGDFDDQFPVDVVQGGAGTSTNMNTNEVIANVALEHLGYTRGRYDVLHPLDDVNRGQSTNDVYPTAIKLAVVGAFRDLLPELAALAHAFAERGRAFAGIAKIGRTQLQDAVPMTLGDEFTAFAVAIREDVTRIEETLPLLLECSLGATAIGTGVTASPRYREAVLPQLALLTGEEVTPALHLFEATWDTSAFLQSSGILRRTAVKLSKICSDLRLLSSGPQAGLAEIRLPAQQAGSSIMPGKVNPVIPEVVNQIAFAVIGADTTVVMAAESGQLQLNAFEPIIAHSLLQSLTWLTNGIAVLRQRCVTGIEANETLLAHRAATSIGSITALVPVIGYDAAAAAAKHALATGDTISQSVALHAGLSAAEVDGLVSS